jgi:hypothetical protein
MKRIIVEIMTEVLSILAIATKEIKQPAASEFIIGLYIAMIHTLSVRYLKKLTGNREVESALQKLDTLTQEEAWMAQAELRRVTHNIERLWSIQYLLLFLVMLTYPSS